VLQGVLEEQQLRTPVVLADWRHLVAGQRAGLRVPATAEVQQHRGALSAHPHVAALHIPVHAVPVHRFQRARYLRQPPDGLAQGVPVLQRPRIRAQALRPLHHQVGVGLAVMAPPAATALQPGH
jgi:hypothetical protein